MMRSMRRTLPFLVINIPNTLSNLREQFAFMCKLNRCMEIPHALLVTFEHTVELDMQAGHTCEAQALARLSHVLIM